MMKPESPGARPPAVSLSAIAIGLWVLLVAFLGSVWLRPSRPQAAQSNTPAIPSSRRDKAEQALALMVSARLEDLGIRPKTVALPQDLSLGEALAIKRGDYARANRIAEGVLARSHLQSWTFYPFAPFMENIVRYEDPILLRRLNGWIASEPRSAIAYLVRGAYYDKVAWITRGSDDAAEVPDQQMRVFREDMSKAGTDFQTAIELDPKIPWSYFALLRAVSRGANPGAAKQVFEAAIKAFPAYYPLYRQRLETLRYGSPSAMYDFVDLYARRAPSNSPIKLLYLQLYANLLETAGSECGSFAGEVKQRCIGVYLDRMTHPDLQAGILQAIKLYTTSDPIQFNTAVWPLLSDMACNRCYGSPAAVGGVLQAAAAVMGSDTQLMDHPGHNSYMLDDVTASVWAQMGNNSNATQKFREALRDAEQTPFPDEAGKAVALATIFDHMTQFADDTSQFIDMIAYQEAENEVGGNNLNHAPFRSCYAYYRMKYFTEAVKECSAIINGNGDYVLSHYWRGKAYEGLGQWDASIADFSRVADVGDNWFRVGAALDMSFDFGGKGDFARQLASLNQHPYLFDPKLQPPDDLAAAYNNRCYAYMQLGQLQKALDDCTTSLKYGRIPDALHKEQELLKRLGNHAIPSSSEPAPKVPRPAANQTT